MSTLRTQLYARLAAFFIIGIAFFVTAMPALAANLVVAPSTGTFSAGQIFIVNVNVSTPDEAMNGVSGKIFFPKDTIEVVGISKNSSIVSLWVQEPGFSNAAGTINFEGVVFNPGYTGGVGKVISITFRAKKAGDAVLTFSESSILANDGQGTEILKNTINGRYTINPASKVEPVKTPSPTTKPTTPSTGIDEQKINLPVITQYSEVMSEEDIFKVQGNTYPDAIVKVFINNDKGQVGEDFVKSDSLGSFRILLPQKLQAGQYKFALQVTTSEGKSSAKTEPISFTVTKKQNFLRIGNYETGLLSFLLFIIILILCVIIGMLYSHHRYIVMKRKMALYIKHLRHAAHSALEPMALKIDDNIRTIEEAKSKRSLTVEEGILLDRQKKIQGDLEDFLKNKLKEVEALADEDK